MPRWKPPQNPRHKTVAGKIVERLYKEQARFQKDAARERNPHAKAGLKGMLPEWMTFWAENHVLTAALRTTIAETKSGGARQIIFEKVTDMHDNTNANREDVQFIKEIKAKLAGKPSEFRWPQTEREIDLYGKKSKETINAEIREYLQTLEARVKGRNQANQLIKRDIGNIAGNRRFWEIVETHRADIWRHIMQIAEEKNRQSG